MCDFHHDNSNLICVEITGVKGIVLDREHFI